MTAEIGAIGVAELTSGGANEKKKTPQLGTQATHIARH